MEKTNKLITILGPTAVGKTKFAARLAAEFNGQIISADSRQVYKRMNIGTGKDLGDYIVDQKKIKYHLIDIISPEKEFNIYSFQKEFLIALNKIYNDHSVPFMVGGSGLYLSSILQRYKMKKGDFNSNRRDELNKLSLEELQKLIKNIKLRQHNTTDLLSKERIIRAILIAENADSDVIINIPDLNNLVIGIFAEREEIKKAITKRLDERLESGMISEVQQLLDSNISLEKLKFFGLEYKFIGMYLSRELNYNDMYQKLKSAIHDFAKRQMTWYRKMEREGIKINWLMKDEIIKAESLISNFII